MKTLAANGSQQLLLLKLESAYACICSRALSAKLPLRLDLFGEPNKSSSPRTKTPRVDLFAGMSHFSGRLGSLWATRYTFPRDSPKGQARISGPRHAASSPSPGAKPSMRVEGAPLCQGKQDSFSMGQCWTIVSRKRPPLHFQALKCSYHERLAR